MWSLLSKFNPFSSAFNSTSTSAFSCTENIEESKKNPLLGWRFNHITFNGDKTLFAMYGHRSGDVQLRLGKVRPLTTSDQRNTKDNIQLELVDPQSESSVCAAAFAPDNRWLAIGFESCGCNRVCSDSTIKFIDLQTK